MDAVSTPNETMSERARSQPGDEVVEEVGQVRRGHPVAVLDRFGEKAEGVEDEGHSVGEIELEAVQHHLCSDAVVGVAVEAHDLVVEVDKPLQQGELGVPAGLRVSDEGDEVTEAKC